MGARTNERTDGRGGGEVGDETYEEGHNWEVTHRAHSPTLRAVAIVSICVWHASRHTHGEHVLTIEWSCCGATQYHAIRRSS